MIDRYEAHPARERLPLVRAIVLEIHERRLALLDIEKRLAFAGATERRRRENLLLKAEAAQHRRRILASLRELEGVGCPLIDGEGVLRAVCWETRPKPNEG